MTPLWTAAELRAATGGTLAQDVAIAGVAIDSRGIAPGDLFVALRDARDGHDFVADALARGAAAAMVDRDPPGVAPDAPLLRVADTLAGLAALGAAGRARSEARCVAVTGSVGKTTTKEMLRIALAAFGPTHAAAASHNNQWGVPLTLARLPRDAVFAVIEIGMNHRGEIAPLTRLARPDVALITTIAPAHIGHLGSLSEIAEEKGDILLGVPRGGVLVAPASSEFFPRLARRAAEAGLAIRGFGEAAGDARLLAYDGDADGGRAEMLVNGERIALQLAAPGRHLAYNATAALAAVAALGLAPRQAAGALAAFGAGSGRGRRLAIAVPGGTALLIDDSYNGQPPAMRAGLAVLGVQRAARRIACLGDMRELGDHGPELHAALAADAAEAADLVFCCGPLMGHLHAALPPEKRGAHLPDSAALVPVLKAALRPGDAVLVKGSLGSRMAVVVDALTKDPRP